MARPKKIPVKTPAEEPEAAPVETLPEVEVPKTEVAVEESDSKKTFRAYMADYKLRKPAKYALKEKGLLKQLEQIK